MLWVISYCCLCFKQKTADVRRISDCSSDVCASDLRPDHVSAYALDPVTWAAGIAQATRRAGIFVTSHAASIHPVLAAKQAATIDHISNGRLTLNEIGRAHV